MPDQYHHGVSVKKTTGGVRPIRTAKSGVIGVVVTAPKGPVNTATLIQGSRAEMIKTFGDEIGTIGQVTDAIFDQIGAQVVVVNVLDPATHNSAIAGAEYTLDATTEQVEVAHNYIYNPVVQSQDLVTTYVLDTDYSVEMETGIVTRITTGAIAAGAVLNIGYDIPDDATINDASVIGIVDGQGKHSGLQALLVAKGALGVKPRILGAPGLDTLAVATELVIIADALKGFAYLYADGANDRTEAVTYRNNFGSARAMVCWPNFLGYDATTDSTITFYAAARALGMRAKIDNDVGFHKTLSNVVVNGVTGIAKDISWDLQNPNTTAGYLNENEITTLIQQDGFRFWGERTCSADPLFAFESATRTDDILADTIADAHFHYIDKAMSKTLVAEIVEGVNAKFREMTTAGQVVYANAWVDPDDNLATQIAAGALTIRYEFTPVPPLENLSFLPVINNDHLIKLVN